MGLSGSGAHNSELQALENQRRIIQNKISGENDRYKQEIDEFNNAVLGEIWEYITDNYDVS